MRKLLIAVIVLAFLPIHCAFAIKVPSLYLVSVPVATQSVEAREQAVQDGFMQVLVKLSGDSQIDTNPLIKENLKRADYYVEEFSYSPSTTSSSEYYLQIRYDKADVNRLLKKAGVSSWGENRPLILVWLAVTDVENNTTELIGNATVGDLLTAMEQQSKKYALPLILPILDVTDVNKVSFNDVAAMSLPILEEAAKRYAPDGLLIGKMQKSNAGIDSQWILILNNKRWNWTLATTTNADATNKIINATLNQVSQLLSQPHLTPASRQSNFWIKMQVSNLTEQRDLSHMMEYIKQLSSVNQIKVKQISGDVAELSVQLHGPLATFQQNALIGQRLAAGAPTAAHNELFYAWVH